MTLARRWLCGRLTPREGSDLQERELVKPLRPGAGTAGYTVRRIRPDDWPTLRTVRLAALADSPLAFETTLAQASAYADSDWQARALRHASADDNSMFLAFDPAGEPVGMMGAELAKDGGRVWVFAVWVAPAHRGGQAATALIDTVAAWARDTLGAAELILEVNATNARAAAFYRRCGFVATGRSRPYPHDPALTELELVKPLR